MEQGSKEANTGQLLLTKKHAQYLCLRLRAFADAFSESVLQPFIHTCIYIYIYIYIYMYIYIDASITHTYIHRGQPLWHF